MKTWKLGLLVVGLVGLASTLMGTAISANRNVDRAVDTEMHHFPAGAAEHIYKGAFVGIDPAGRARPFEPGDRLAGVAYKEADNSSGDAAAIDAYTRDGDYVLTLSGVGADDVGKPVFATDSGAVTWTGHPDAYFGRIVGVYDTNKAMVRFRPWGVAPPNGIGSIIVGLTGHETYAATGATAGTSFVGAWELKSILGPGFIVNDAEDGGILLAFDATAEVALNSVRTTNDIFPVDKGITFEVDLVVSDIGDNAALDIDWGLGTALTTNSEASIDHADMVNLMCFHLDGNADTIYFQSDNNTTDVAPVDTTVANDSTTDASKHFKIVIRPDGEGEAWIEGSRVLSSTTFSVSSSANLAAFVNMEKTSDNTTASLLFKNLSVKAGAAY